MAQSLLDSWSENENHFDFISCLNLLDRCENPLDILGEMKKSLKPNGLILIALVLPFRPYVELTPNHQPIQRLDIQGTLDIEQFRLLLNSRCCITS
jgi:2-polyprenyl-3-methyl-5-hydroxy-6-metoxy-1,4-benzoquinol methylase